jgi:glutamyl-tRNA synthetase
VDHRRRACSAQGRRLTAAHAGHHPLCSFAHRALHVGNIRTALHNWLLRPEGRRAVPAAHRRYRRGAQRGAFVEAIRDDLALAGADFDGEERQSARLALYEARSSGSKAAGGSIPLTRPRRSSSSSARSRSARLPPIYDRAALQLSEAERARTRRRRRTGASSSTTSADRMARRHPRPQHFDAAQMSESGGAPRRRLVALHAAERGRRRRDGRHRRAARRGSCFQTLAVQIQMFTALDAPVPRFAHEALLVGSEGKLSKRLGSLGADSFREQGIEPEAIVALLARLGTSEPVEADSSNASCWSRRSISPTSAARRRTSTRPSWRGSTPDRPPACRSSTFAARLPEGIDAKGWEAIRPNLEKVSDAADWWSVVTGPIEPPALDDETSAYLGEAARSLAWGDDPLGALTAALKDRTGRKGKALFHPLRLALTGRESGPTCTRCCR